MGWVPSKQTQDVIGLESGVAGGRATSATVLSSPQDDFEPTAWQQTVAAFQRENLVGSVLSSEQVDLPTADFFKVDDNYNPFDDLSGYEEYEDRFVNVFNTKAANAVKADIDRERRNEQVLNAGGWTSVGLQIGAAVADPTILLPGGAVVRSGRVGYSAAKTVGSVGLAAAAGTAVQETGLQLTQQTRTAAESAVNIAGSAILGGMAGGAIATWLSHTEASALARRIDVDLETPAVNPYDVTESIVRRAQAAGAASVADVKIDDLGPAGSWDLELIRRATQTYNPGVQTMLSPSQKVRKVYAEMVDNPIFSKMEMEGRTFGPAVENRAKYWQQGVYSSWVREARKLHKEARRAGEKITYRDFMTRIGRAARRGDVDPDSDFVTKAAQSARSKMSDPLLREAQEANILPTDIKTETAESYFHRMWNARRLQGEEARFKDIARSWVKSRINAMEKTPDDIRFLDENDLDGYVEEVADSVYNKLTGRAFDDVPEWLVPVTRGPLKERTFRIPDEMVEDFLEDDAEIVFRRYTRTMGAEVELARKFGRADMRDQLEEIGRDYDELRKAVARDKSIDDTQRQKKLRKLNKAERRDRANLEAFRDMIRGTYRQKEEASTLGAVTRGWLTWNYVVMLGGVLLTSIGDVAAIPAAHGLRATLSEGLPELTRTLRGVSLSRAEAKELGAVSDVIMGGRFASLAELNDPFAYGSRYERTLDNVSLAFSRLTMLGFWNDLTKGIDSTLTMNRVIRNSQAAFDDLDRYERGWMANLGIDEDMAKRIARQYRQHGRKQGSSYLPNSARWSDKEAHRVFAAAVNKHADITIVTPGVSDKPLALHTNTGKIIAQFTSFLLSGNQRWLMRGLQGRAHRLGEFLLLGTVMGMLISWAKYVERGDTERANDLLENPGKWVADGLDRSGIIGVLFDVVNRADKVSSSYGGPELSIQSAVSKLAGDRDSSGPPSRYANRNASGAILGPSIGRFEDLANVAAGMMKGDVNRSQANALLRQIPGANLPGVKSGLYIGVRPMVQNAVE